MDASLQKLTDRQVELRLAAYADDGRFSEAMRAFWDAAGALVEEAARRHSGEEEAQRIRDYCTRPFDAAWIHHVAEPGFAMYTQKSRVPDFVAARASLAADIIAAIEDRFDD
jgi:hypothetical protein